MVDAVMTWWQALVLGIVEGVTEYLPVSSTGHLLLAQRLLGLEQSDANNAYAICIQGGAIVAVLGLYARRVGQVGAGLTGRDPSGLALGRNLAIAFLPAAVLGPLLDDAIEGVLFGLPPIVFAWAVGGIAILAFSRWQAAADRPDVALESLGARAALLIGLAQCVAMWPGTSRSLVTIVAGVLVGLSMTAAVEFAFLLGVITLGAATAFKAVQHGDVMLATFGPGPIAVGFLSAWLSAVLAVKWMVAWLNQRGLAIFGWWRILVAGLAAALLASGVL
jgi:undecaprenyl-diphosphatase